MKEISKRLLSVLTAIAIIFTIFATPVGEIIGFVGEGVKAGAAGTWIGSSSWGYASSDSTALTEVKTAMSKTTSSYYMQRFEKILSEYPLSGYFNSYKTKACSWHCGSCGTAQSTCISKFYDDEISNDVNLHAKQCYGYARYCFYRFHKINLGEQSGQVDVLQVKSGFTANSVKSFFDENAIIGAHLRSEGHSMVYLTHDDTNIYFIDANSGYNSATSCTKNCSANSSHYTTNCKIHLKKISFATLVTKYADSGFSFTVPKEVKIDLSSAPNNLGTQFVAPIKVTSTGKVLTANADGNVTVADWKGTDNQRWIFTKNSSDNYYEIRNGQYYQKVLDVADAGNVNDANIQIWEDNDTSAQRFGVYGSQGSYVIKPKYSTTHVIDSDGGNSNVHLWQYYSNGIDAQKFTISPEPTTRFDTFSATNITTNDARVKCNAYKRSEDKAVKYGVVYAPADTWNNTSSRKTFYSTASTTNVGKTYREIYFDFGSEIGDTLKPDTTYNYYFVAVYNMDGVDMTFSSSVQSFKTSASCSTHSYGNWVTKTAASCTADGLKQRTCSKCGKIESATITKLGHSYTSSVTKVATCTATGVRTYKCSKCTYSYTENIAATGHSYGAWTSTAATCTEKGVSTRTCSKCSNVETNYTNSLGHNYITYTIQPTYISKGFSHHLCSRCSAEYKDNYTSNIKSIPSTSFTVTASGKAVTLKIPTTPLIQGYTITRKCNGVVDKETSVTDSAYRSFNISGFNKERGANEIIVYTRYGTYAETNIYGNEIVVDADGYVIDERGYGSEVKSIVPKGGFVVSMHNPSTEFANIAIGDRVAYDMESKTLMVYYAGTAGESITYIDTTVENGKTYTYTVTPYVKNIKGSSSEKQVTITPSSVANFRNTAKTDKSLTLAWNKNTSADGYVIQMLYGTTWKSIKTVSGNATTSCTITGLAPSITYNFRICTYKTVSGATYYSAYTDKMSAITLPGAVANFRNTAKTDTSLTLAWDKNTTADGYIIEQYKSGKWVRIAKIASNATTTYRATGLAAGTAYKFRMKAYKMDGSTALYSSYTSTLSARTNPSKVSGLKLGGRAADALRLNWTKNTSADGYIIEQYKDGKWVRIKKITSNATTTYRVTGLKASTQYKFRVRAYKMSGKTALYSGYTSTLSAYTNPSKVANLKITGKASNALRLGWSKNASADGYIVEMYKDGKWVRVAKITSNATVTFRKSGLKKGTTYKFRVRTYNMVGKTALYGSYVNVNGKTNS